ncbi:hypothetical protein SLA2020_421080 [Shorea laevis]
MGVGVIVRDSDGAVVATLCSLVPYISDPTLAEGVALWRAVLLCIELEIPGFTWKVIPTKLFKLSYRKAHVGVCMDI